MEVDNISYHLHRARPEYYLDTILNLMIPTVQGKVYGPEDFQIFETMEFFANLSEKELYDIFLNFYASSFSTRITDEGKGLLLFCALFSIVFRAEYYPSNSLVHVDSGYVYNLFKSEGEFLNMLSELVFWYISTKYEEEIVDLWGITDDISIAVESVENFDFSNLQNTVNNILDDLMYTSAKIISTIGLYMEKLIQFDEIEKEIVDTVTSVFLDEYDNCFWINISMGGVKSKEREIQKMDEIKSYLDKLLFGNDDVHNQGINGFRVRVREALNSMCEI